MAPYRTEPAGLMPGARRIEPRGGAAKCPLNSRRIFLHSSPPLRKSKTHRRLRTFCRSERYSSYSRREYLPPPMPSCWLPRQKQPFRRGAFVTAVSLSLQVWPEIPPTLCHARLFYRAPLSSSIRTQPPTTKPFASLAYSLPRLCKYAFSVRLRISIRATFGPQPHQTHPGLQPADASQPAAAPFCPKAH